MESEQELDEAISDILQISGRVWNSVIRGAELPEISDAEYQALIEARGVLEQIEERTEG
jgi:hypothetical protein